MDVRGHSQRLAAPGQGGRVADFSAPGLGGGRPCGAYYRLGTESGAEVHRTLGDIPRDERC
jgi:hypothetical protein